TRTVVRIDTVLTVPEDLVPEHPGVAREDLDPVLGVSGDDVGLDRVTRSDALDLDPAERVPRDRQMRDEVVLHRREVNAETEAPDRAVDDRDVVPDVVVDALVGAAAIAIE